MKRSLFYALSLLLFSNNFAAGKDIVTKAKSETEVEKKSFLSKVHADLDLTTQYIQDDESSVLVGFNNILETSFAYKINSKQKVVFMNALKLVARDDKDTETTYEAAQLEYKFKALSYERDGVYLKLDGRFSYLTNVDTRAAKNSFGAVQARAYWGLPLGAGFSINKSLTYFRLEKHLIDKDFDKSKNLAWRVRVAPNYSITDNFDFTLLTTYRGYSTNKDKISQKVKFAPSFRYEYKQVAVTVAAEYTAYSTKKGKLAYNEDFLADPLFTTNLVVDLF